MSPQVDFSRRYHFSSSHRLHVDEFSDKQNWSTFGKCNNPHGHGHNYTLEVTVRGPVDAETGMVLNMVELDRMVKQSIVDRFHIQNLNHDPLFAIDVSTTENLCRAAWRILNDQQQGHPFGTAQIVKLRIEETSNNFFEYAGEHTGKRN
jgi:6-pyruvoyltetrahydropterin/6-carboxytetrahydropterin synthase